jgi:DNA-binding NarL/FixJ family response regulator
MNPNMQWTASHHYWVVTLHRSAIWYPLMQPNVPHVPGTPEKIRVLVVDDHPVLREGIAVLLAQQPDLLMVGEASTGREAIEQFRQTRPDVTLMDIQMPDMSGIDAIIAIREEAPDARIVVLTTYEGDVLAWRALKAGAHAYVLKGNVRKDLADTIRAVHGGDTRIEPAIATQLDESQKESNLTTREVEVLILIAGGNSNRLIASRLQINEATAKTHVKNILAKLGANDRTHAVTLALRRGIIQL